MIKNYDQSQLDKKYFIDEYKYNCPYCNRKSITYKVVSTFKFYWSNERIVYGYRIKCGGDSCEKISLHLSNYEIDIDYNRFEKVINYQIEGEESEKYIEELLEKEIELDNLFFYHQPTTFFTLDNRINKNIRTLISEAEGCSKMGYMVGASGCLRKVIYELLQFEKIAQNNGDNKISYEERIKKLKEKYPLVTKEYFDALSNIQNMASKQLHEGNWKSWTQKEFEFYNEVIKEILNEIYVKPKEQASVLTKILSLNPPYKKNNK